MSTDQERALWRRRATWLTQLSLDEGEYAPVEVLEAVAEATLALLSELDLLERERAEARAWAWAERHGGPVHEWVTIPPGRHDGDPARLPAWLTDVRTPPEQDWWPATLRQPTHEPLPTEKEPR